MCVCFSKQCYMFLVTFRSVKQQLEVAFESPKSTIYCFACGDFAQGFRPSHDQIA